MLCCNCFCVCDPATLGAAVARASELAVSFVTAAVKESTQESEGCASIVACDNDFVETLASLGGVKVVELLSKFEKASPDCSCDGAI